MDARRPPTERPLAALWLSLLLGCASPLTTERGPAVLPAPGVSGRVRLLGVVPERWGWEVDEQMRAACGLARLADETWLVDAGGGLANCVLVLEPADGAGVPSAPAGASALYEKVGPRYEPRVLAVQRGTRVTLRNRDSPCQGFVSQAKRAQFFEMLPAGQERTIDLQRAGPVSVHCPIRDYMRGAIYVSPTPWYAVTLRDGSFDLGLPPPGSYRVRLWHEALGHVDDLEPAEVRVRSDRPLWIEYALAGR